MMMDCQNLIKVSFLDFYPHCTFSGLPPLFLLTQHTGTVKEAEMGVWGGVVIISFLTLELKINNWNRMEERKWAGVGV